MWSGTLHQLFSLFQSTSSIKLYRSVSLTVSIGYHVKPLWEQLQLHSIPPLLFLTSGDTVTVDLSSPIMKEVFTFLYSRLPVVFSPFAFLFETCYTPTNQIVTYRTAVFSSTRFSDNTADNSGCLLCCIVLMVASCVA